VKETIQTRTWTDGEGNLQSKAICNVTLTNKDLSHLPVVSMSHHTMGMYALYMGTHGNMEGIFHGPHATPLKDPLLYDIPQATLDADPAFAKLMEEANKYVGYPYVWGGSSPATSFDCSGYVSWVINHSGWNVGRLGAQGLYNICTSTSSPKPGDLVFFKGTYNTPGVSHCGIYVGDGRMLHCGDPIGYANLNTSYWQSHFYAYGRLP
jgi:cell wall-associated NlpC family hydrolase